MRTICLLLLLCPCFIIAQHPPKQYTVGEHLPPVLIQQVLSASGTKTKPKLLLLSFTTIYCNASKKCLPQFAAVQQQFGKALLFVQAVPQSPAQLKAAAVSDTVLANANLHFISNQNLQPHFSYVTMPHVIWLTPSGKIIAITGAQYVTSANITHVLQGKPVHWPVKNDSRDFNYTTPLFGAVVFGNTSKGHAGFTPHIAGTISRYVLQKDTATATTRMAIYNYTIPKMYLLAIAKPVVFPLSHIRLQVKDTAAFVQPASAYTAEWESTNTFCYEAVKPGLHNSNAMRSDLLADLDRFFGLHSFYGVKEVPCYKLVVTDTAKLISKGGKFQNTLYTSNATKLLRNGSIDNLLWELNNTWLNLPVIDATGITTGIDLEMHVSNWQQNHQLTAQLAKHGLALVPATAPLELLEITDQHFSQH